MDLPVIDELEKFKDPFLTDINPQLRPDFTFCNDWLENYVGIDIPVPTSQSDSATTASTPLHLSQSNENATKHSPPRKESLPISDDELTELTVRDLNKKIRSLDLTKSQIQSIRRRRRSLKNRGYALTCRHRRLNENEELANENNELNKELKKLKDELGKVTKERDKVKKEYEKMKTYFNAVCSTSAMNTFALRSRTTLSS